MPVTIEQDLKEVLGEINQKLESINNRLRGRLKSQKPTMDSVLA
jgi:hypothetical protein